MKRHGAVNKIQEKQMNIAFQILGDEVWVAERVYLNNLFFALRNTYEKQIGLYFIEQPDKHDVIGKYTHNLDVDGIISCPLPLIANIRILNKIIRRLSVTRIANIRILNKITQGLPVTDRTVQRCLDQYGVDVLFGHVLSRRLPQIRTLSWLPDFQHVHLPEMFSDSEKIYRDRAFMLCAKRSDRVILSSESVRRDFELFAPNYVYKARIFHPISYIPQSVYDEDLNVIKKLYNLPEKFFYLPNQFWKHKNHELVFRAVKALKEKGEKILIVCTGSPSDYRHPGYHTQLFNKVSQWNLHDNIIYLGLVPREHVLLFIRQSICVLNPSLFEGFSMTVEEAESVGKQLLISDIPVHRERKLSKVTFFNPRDCGDLMEKLTKIWHDTLPGPDIELELKARQELPNRLRSCAEAFIKIAKEKDN